MIELVYISILFFTGNYIKEYLVLSRYSFFKALLEKNRNYAIDWILNLKIFYCKNCCAFWYTFFSMCTLNAFNITYLTIDYNFLWSLVLYNFNNLNSINEYEL